MEEQLDEAKGGSQSSERVAQPGASGAPPQTPEFSALRPGLALNQNADERWLLATTLANPAATPALMVRLKAVRESSGDRILPALYSDNYIALMPGERRVIRVEVADRDTRGQRPQIAISGFNVKAGRAVVVERTD